MAQSRQDKFRQKGIEKTKETYKKQVAQCFRLKRMLSIQTLLEENQTENFANNKNDGSFQQFRFVMKILLLVQESVSFNLKTFNR